MKVLLYISLGSGKFFENVARAQVLFYFIIQGGLFLIHSHPLDFGSRDFVNIELALSL